MDIVKLRLIFMGSVLEVVNVMNGVILGSVKGLIIVGVNLVYFFLNIVFVEVYKNFEMSFVFVMKEDEIVFLV